MCGIAFTYRPDLGKDELSRTMARTLKRLAYRGPDGSGQVADANWCMGHQRLSVIDPAGSSQPFRDSAGRFFLSYNGELYNYQELRSRLKDDWTFTTAGDTEVVLAGLMTYGVAFLKLMEGMWALALWDTKDHQLLLVRDRLGQKPIYYQWDHRHFACASEIRALSALSWRPWQEDLRSTADYFRYGFFLPGTTAYKNVFEVLPGYWLKWSPGKAPHSNRYWRLSPGGYSGPKERAVAMIKEALIDGVRRRLVADVEVGALLSGGIDSALIVSIIATRLERKIKTFTIGFEEPEYDERRHARVLAGKCGTDHIEACMRLEDSEALVGLILENVGQPFGDASLLPTAMVSRLASKHLKVVVSGDGGDELFSGYNRYLARSFLRWYTRLPSRLKDSLSGRMDRLPGLGLHCWPEKMIFRLMDMVRRMEDEIPYVAPLHYHGSQFRQLLPDIWRKAHAAPNMPGMGRLDDLHEMMTADALIYLPQDILAKVDRAGMAFSIEIRSPLLDRRLVELAFSLPAHWHRRGLRGKRILRAAFENQIPDPIWQRPKQGFAVPLDRWFRNGLAHQLNGLMARTCHPLNKPLVNRLVTEHLSGRWDHGIRLWNIYIYLRWLVSLSRWR